MFIALLGTIVVILFMRNKASIRRQRREMANNRSDLVHDADNTTSMLAIQGLVEKARHVSGEVQKGIIRAGLQRHLYPFEPRQKQIDAIWHLVFKKEDLLLAAKTSFGKSVIFQAAPLFCRGGLRSLRRARIGEIDPEHVVSRH